MLHKEITSEIIGAFYEVYNQLGYGFLESVYEKSLAIELQRRGLAAVRQSKITVYYKTHVVGEFFADLIVNNNVIVELKAVETVHPQHEAQILNYLKASHIEVGLLLNFGKQAQILRKIFSNNLKDIRRKVS